MGTLNEHDEGTEICIDGPDPIIWVSKDMARALLESYQSGCGRYCRVTPSLNDSIYVRKINNDLYSIVGSYQCNESCVAWDRVVTKSGMDLIVRECRRMVS